MTVEKRKAEMGAGEGLHSLRDTEARVHLMIIRSLVKEGWKLEGGSKLAIEGSEGTTVQSLQQHTQHSLGR
jgi:hypothetical protein